MVSFIAQYNLSDVLQKKFTHHTVVMKVESILKTTFLNQAVNMFNSAANLALLTRESMEICLVLQSVPSGQ